MKEKNKPNYGNWVPLKMIYVSFIISALFFCINIFVPFFIFPVFGGLFALFFLHFLYAYIKFSTGKKNLQSVLRDLVVEKLNWNGEGKALDIGCGNGPMVMDLAKKYKNARVVGIDYWGKAWDYSIRLCEQNAVLEGVAERVSFQKASASKLPFPDASFEAVVSNFVFHEVSDVKNKADCIKEALRVLKKGGVFSFQDLFLQKNFYGDISVLQDTILSWGVQKVEFINTTKLPLVPALLKVPHMLGGVGIICGKK